MAFQRNNVSAPDSCKDYEDALYQVASKVTGSQFSQHLLSAPPYRKLEPIAAATPLPLSHDPGNFKYNIITVAIFIPGFLFILNFCGDLLPAIIAIGAFVVHLMCSAREHSGAVIMVLLIWIICQFLIFYKTCMFLFGLLGDLHLFVSHIPLMVFTNMFSVLTLGWILMMFREFRRKDYRLLRIIESSLMTLYPISTSVLISYIVVHWTDVWIAPYAFIITGFVYLNVTLKPRESSFKPPPSVEGRGSEQKSPGVAEVPSAGDASSSVYIVEYNLGVITLLTYNFLPACTLVVCKLWYTTTTVFSAAPPHSTPHHAAAAQANTRFGYSLLLLSTHLLYPLVEILFGLLSSIFLTTFLHVRFYLFNLDVVSSRGISVVRWIAGACAVSLLEFLSSSLVPKLWMSLFPTILALHIMLIYSINMRKSTQAVAFICVILLLVYLGIMSTLPWNLEYP